MKPARYIFLNQELGMSTGKAAAQAAHAETLAMQDFMNDLSEIDKLDPAIQNWVNKQKDLFDVWFGYGHYAKYVMRAEDATQMYTIERYLDDRDFETYTVIDEGRTEGTYFVPTALAVELVDRDDERVQSIFGEFKLYKDLSKSPTIRKPWYKRL